MHRPSDLVLAPVFICIFATSSVAQPKLLRTLDLDESASGWAGVFELQYSRNGQWIASSHGLQGRKTVTRWNVSNGTPIAYRLFGELAVIHPDCDTVVSDGTNGPINLWNMTQRKSLGKLNHQGQVLDAAVSPNGKTMAVFGFGSQITLWDVTIRKKTFVLPHPPQVASMQFSPDGKTLVSISQTASLTLASLKVWDISTGKELGSMMLAPSPVKRAKDLLYTYAISSDGKRLGLPSPQTGEAALFELKTLKIIATVKDTAPASIQLSPDGKTAAVISLSPHQKSPFSIQLFDIENRRPLNLPIQQNQGPGSILCGFSPDSQLLVFGCLDGNLRLWDVSTGELRATLPGAMKGGLVMPVAFSPDGKSIAVGMGRSIKIWDISGL